MKALKLIFIFLVVVTIVELVYYFLIFAQKNNQIPSLLFPKQVQQAPTKIPMNVEEVESSQNDVFIRSVSKNMVTSAFITRKFEGVIDEVWYTESGKEMSLYNRNNKAYQYKTNLYISLRSHDNKEKHNFYYNENELQNASVVIKSNKATFSDLKKGDVLILEETSDLKKLSGSKVNLLKLTVN